MPELLIDHNENDYEKELNIPNLLKIMADIRQNIKILYRNGEKRLSSLEKAKLHRLNERVTRLLNL